MQKISGVQYQMTDGGTITVSKAAKGWKMAFDFGSDASLNFAQTVPSVPDFMEVVTTYCGPTPTTVSID